MSISYPGKFDDYKKYLLRVKPFLVKADSSTARKFEIYKKMKDGKIFENEKIRAKANHSLVSDYVDKINTLDNVKVLHSRLIQLRELSAYKRIGHHPNVLKCLEDSLGNSMITQNPETFRLVIETLENILGYEQQIKEEDSEAILKIRKEITTKLILLLKTKPDYLRYSLSLLGYSERKEAVELIFKKIEKDPEKALEGVVDSLFYELSRALAKLYLKHRELIDKRLDKLIESDDTMTSNVGMDLRKRILHENHWRIE